MTNEKQRIDMENIAPPPPQKKDGVATEANENDVNALATKTFAIRSIEGAAAQFRNECNGGDRYKNNCAHFLSDAFIKAGYSELLPPNDCVNARCSTPDKRVIRARDMWCWFKSIAIESRTSIPHNDGFWAVFQLDEGIYWGGHVVIIDTDNNKYYGTGHYPSWEQYAYKW